MSVDVVAERTSVGVHAVTPAIGAELTGVDLNRVTDDEVAEIRRALLPLSMP